MSRLAPLVAISACLFVGCAGAVLQPPVEMLDERSGLTVAALAAPITLLPVDAAIAGRRPSFAYLGPVEWNRMGSFTHGLWVHLAPGQYQPLADIHDPAALTLTLDDGVLELHPMAAPVLAREPYRPAVPWGQTVYFSLTPHDLRRLAASTRLTLRCAAADGSPLTFAPAADVRGTLGAYLSSRGLTGD